MNPAENMRLAVDLVQQLRGEGAEAVAARIRRTSMTDLIGTLVGLCHLANTSLEEAARLRHLPADRVLDFFALRADVDAEGLRWPSDDELSD